MEPIAMWRATYTPGRWVVLSGPRSMVIMRPAPPQASGLFNQVWDEVVRAASIHDLASTLATFRVDSMPDFGAFFWTDTGLSALVRGIQVLDPHDGTVLADGEGAQTWREVSLATTSLVRVQLEPVDQETVLQLPLMVGCVLASAVQLDSAEDARIVLPTSAAADEAPAAIVPRAADGSQPEPEAQPKPEGEPESLAEPEPVLEPAPEPVSEAEPEPEPEPAADQGPPADDTAPAGAAPPVEVGSDVPPAVASAEALVASMWGVEDAEPSEPVSMDIEGPVERAQPDTGPAEHEGDARVGPSTGSGAEGGAGEGVGGGGPSTGSGAEGGAGEGVGGGGPSTGSGTGADASSSGLSLAEEEPAAPVAAALGLDEERPAPPAGPSGFVFGRIGADAEPPAPSAPAFPSSSQGSPAGFPSSSQGSPTGFPSSYGSPGPVPPLPAGLPGGPGAPIGSSVPGFPGFPGAQLQPSPAAVPGYGYGPPPGPQPSAPGAPGRPQPGGLQGPGPFGPPPQGSGPFGPPPGQAGPPPGQFGSSPQGPGPFGPPPGQAGPPPGQFGPSPQGPGPFGPPPGQFGSLPQGPGPFGSPPGQAGPPPGQAGPPPGQFGPSPQGPGPFGPPPGQFGSSPQGPGPFGPPPGQAGPPPGQFGSPSQGPGPFGPPPGPFGPPPGPGGPPHQGQFGAPPPVQSAPPPGAFGQQPRLPQGPFGSPPGPGGPGSPVPAPPMSPAPSPGGGAPPWSPSGPPTAVPPPPQPAAEDEEVDGGTIFSTSIAASHKPAAQRSMGDFVLAGVCNLGHPNRPGATVCRRCGGTVDTANPKPVARPSMATLVTSGGATADLVDTVLIGRSPSAQRGDSTPLLLPVPSPNNDISRTHVRVAAKDWDVVVTDISTNGTLLIKPGEAPQRMGPGSPTVVPIGTVLDLGDGVQITVGEPA